MNLAWIVIVIVLIGVLYVVVLYNRLVRLRNLAREGWSGIDVQLRRRTDLIPNLVDTVKAYAAHERVLFEEVARKRASSMAAADVVGAAAAERELQGSLGRLMALAEGYPALKADQNFLKLQEQLADIEDQLQMARRYYNGTARNLNVAIQSFPNALVAGPFGFQEAAYFELGDRAEADAPQVSLARP